MSATIKYQNKSINPKVVRDFLPPPEELIYREEDVKINIILSKSSIEFFKEEAKKQHTKYKLIIRHLIDAYVKKHK